MAWPPATYDAFTIYASKLFEVVKRHLPEVYAYVDDN